MMRVPLSLNDYRYSRMENLRNNGYQIFLQWILYALLLLVLKYNENGWTEFDSKHIMAECNHNTLYMHLKLTKIKNVH